MIDEELSRRVLGVGCAGQTPQREGGRILKTFAAIVWSDMNKKKNSR